MASDIVKAQEMLFEGLLSCPMFDAFNVVMERRFLMQSEVEFNAIWQSPRLIDYTDPTTGEKTKIADPNGKVGNGLFVEMPKLRVPYPNSLQRFLEISVASIEERNLNMAPSAEGSAGGTQTSAEELAEMAHDFMFGWVMGLSSALVPEESAVTPATDLVKADGLMAYRATVLLKVERRPIARCANPTAQTTPGVVTLTNGASSPDAEIWYMRAGTTGDLRCPCKANPAAQLYQGAINDLEIGEFINWAAWPKAGTATALLLPSHITVAKIS